MKLLSLNCNKFAGAESDGKGEFFQEEILQAVVEAVKQFLHTGTKHLVILHEVNYRKEYLVYFQNAFPADEYTLYLPTHVNEINKGGRHIRPYGCTLAISGKQSAWQQCESLEQNPKQHDYANKSVILKHGELYVVGIHMPYDISFWDTLIAYYRQHRKEEIVMIGDFNVFDCGTKRKEKLDQLMQLGAIDAWTQSEKDPLKPTCNTGKRIDYAFMSLPAYRSFHEIQLQDSFRNNGISDHAALIVDIK